MSPRGKRLNASEIGQYAFCARAWWLNMVKKLEPVNVAELARGIAAHERHGWQVSLARSLNKVAIAMFGGGVLAVLIWAVARLIR